MSHRQDEDDAWRAIVANYGDRAELDDGPVADVRPEPAPAGPATPSGSAQLDEPAVPQGSEKDEPEERFVPPVPPPAPRLPLPRRLAWLAVIGSPAALVLALLLSVDVPRLLGYGLVAAFLGGFGYLVWTMQRSGERDPWDDGAQV